MTSAFSSWGSFSVSLIPYVTPEVSLFSEPSTGGTSLPEHDGRSISAAVISAAVLYFLI